MMTIMSMLPFYRRVKIVSLHLENCKRLLKEQIHYHLSVREG